MNGQVAAPENAVMTLAIDVTATLSGTTMTLTLSVGASYGIPVSSFTIDPLVFDATASYVRTTAGAGYTAIPNLVDAVTVRIAGIISDGTSTTGAGSVLATLTFTVDPTSTSFNITQLDGSLNEDGPDTGFSGGVTVACFAAGTLIRTPQGEVPVETLAVGDLVCTTLGAGPGPVTWIGHRRIDCRGHARPQDVQPIRIAQNALADGVPQRALVLSPDHALYLDGVLIPARYLLNGATIVQQQVARITYFHVEVDHHDVLLAEGTPAETYLDTGNRAAFAPPGSIAFTSTENVDFARDVWAGKSCAQLVVNGPILASVRKRLLERAYELGHATCNDAELCVSSNGQKLQLETTPSGWRINLPPGTRHLQLRSRTVVPAHRDAEEADHRLLGTAIASLVADGVPIALDDSRFGSGWHSAEAGWRWTNGEANLDVSGVGVLELTTAMTQRYWVETLAIDLAA
jgi:hypothetical protein